MRRRIRKLIGCYQMGNRLLYQGSCLRQWILRPGLLHQSHILNLFNFEIKHVNVETSNLNLIFLFHLFRLEMVLRIIRHGQDQKIWPAQDHLTRSIATDLDPMLLPRLLHHLLLHQSCSREKMMIILPSCWIMPKECTSLPMNAEENIPTRFMMPASSTSIHFYY